MLPGFWIIVSLTGMLVTVVGTAVMALFSSPSGEKQIEKMLERNTFSEARKARDRLKEEGEIENVKIFNQLIDFPGDGPSHLNKIEQMDDRPGGIRYHFDSTTEEAHIRNLSKAIDEKKERVVKKNKVRAIIYGLEIVFIGFALQFASMLARHVVIVG